MSLLLQLPAAKEGTHFALSTGSDPNSGAVNFLLSTNATAVGLLRPGDTNYVRGAELVTWMPIFTNPPGTCEIAA